MLRAAAVALLLSLPAAAGGMGGISPGEALRPGELRAIPGSGERIASMDVDEAELVLSLDGGRTFALRVSFEQAPSSGDLLFLVPNLPASRAVLGLRAGRDGEEETVVAVSETFTISFSPGAPPESLGIVRGEGATREAGGREEPRLPRGALEGRPPELSAAGDPVEGEDDSDDGIAAPPAPSSVHPVPPAPPSFAAGERPEATLLAASLSRRE